MKKQKPRDTAGKNTYISEIQYSTGKTWLRAFVKALAKVLKRI